MSSSKFTYNLDVAKELPSHVYETWMRYLHGQAKSEWVTQSHFNESEKALVIVCFQQGQGLNIFGLQFKMRITNDAVDCQQEDFGQVYYLMTPKEIYKSMKYHGVRVSQEVGSEFNEEVQP